MRATILVVLALLAGSAYAEFAKVDEAADECALRIAKAIQSRNLEEYQDSIRACQSDLAHVQGRMPIKVIGVGAEGVQIGEVTPLKSNLYGVVVNPYWRLYGGFPHAKTDFRGACASEHNIEFKDSAMWAYGPVPTGFQQIRKAEGCVPDSDVKGVHVHPSSCKELPRCEFVSIPERSGYQLYGVTISRAASTSGTRSRPAAKTREPDELDKASDQTHNGTGVGIGSTSPASIPTMVEAAETSLIHVGEKICPFHPRTKSPLFNFPVYAMALNDKAEEYDPFQDFWPYVDRFSEHLNSTVESFKVWYRSAAKDERNINSLLALGFVFVIMVVQRLTAWMAMVRHSSTDFYTLEGQICDPPSYVRVLYGFIAGLISCYATLKAWHWTSKLAGWYAPVSTEVDHPEGDYFEDDYTDEHVALSVSGSSSGRSCAESSASTSTPRVSEADDDVFHDASNRNAGHAAIEVAHRISNVEHRRGVKRHECNSEAGNRARLVHYLNTVNHVGFFDEDVCAWINNKCRCNHLYVADRGAHKSTRWRHYDVRELRSKVTNGRRITLYKLTADKRKSVKLIFLSANEEYGHVMEAGRLTLLLGDSHVTFNVSTNTVKLVPTANTD